MSTHLKQSLRRVWYGLPESRMKDFVRMGGGWKALHPTKHPMVREISRLAVEDAAETADGARYIKLQEGPTFLAWGPPHIDIPACTHAYLHRHLHPEVRGKLPKSHMDIAADIVCRYAYPHADPTITLPYSNRERGTFHPQHRDTIEDIPDTTGEQRAELSERFKIRRGDIVLDIGSYIGYGAMKLSEMVGSNGQVVSVEADNRNQAMFRRNIAANAITNVQLVDRAIWSDRGSRQIFWNDSQLNSLVDGVVLQHNSREVETDSVDNIVEELELPTVSLVSLTVNGAEIEAVRGMQQTLKQHGPRLSIAGWYERDGFPIYREVTRILSECGYQTQVGRFGRVYGWPQ